MSLTSSQNEDSVYCCFKWVGVGSSGPGPFYSWDFQAEKEDLRAAFISKILLQTNWTIQELTICVGLMQRAWIPVLLGAKPGRTTPFPSESAGFQQLALIWALSPLLALENLHLEGWLWFPEAVTHTPSKVNAAVSREWPQEDSRDPLLCSQFARWAESKKNMFESRRKSTNQRRK